LIEVKNNKAYVMLEEDVAKSLHKEAFEETYTAIKNFSSKSNEVYSFLKKKDIEDNDKYIHNVLCSAPGHGKTTALEYHIKEELVQTDTKKNPYLLVFNNEDTQNIFFKKVNAFVNKYLIRNSILSITESNIDLFRMSLNQYQVLCITQQRLRDLALDIGNRNSFLTYQQEASYWGRKPDNINKTMVQRTIIIDEMPIFFNSTIFDIGKDDNSVDWFDSLVNNTESLTAQEKYMGRLYINQLVSNELSNVGNTTKRLIRSFEGKEMESQINNILDKLNTKGSEPKQIVRFNWFKRLLREDDVGAINRTNLKTNILCSEKIDYKPFGNILILDGTSHLTHTIYYHFGFELQLITNYHDYIKRLYINWRSINTGSYARNDSNKEIREQISEDILNIRGKGENILPIPSKGDKGFYISTGAITYTQYEKFYKDREFEGDSLAINIHNVTGKNDLSSYSHISLLNLPIMPPHEYKLKAIALYGADIDLRLVKELTDKEEKELYKNQWFADRRIQRIFEQQQKAELSQIIHRSSIRFINSSEKVTISLYHNKKQVIEMLKEVFNLPDDNVDYFNLQWNNRFKHKCSDWAEKLLEVLKDNPNVDYTAGKLGGSKFKKWLENHWSANEKDIREIFKKNGISINIKGKGNYKYFSYSDDEIFEELFG
jgi:hypothetical protein